MSPSCLPSGVPKRRGHGHPSGQRLSLPGGRDLPSLRLPAGQSHRQREGPADGVLQDEPSPGRVQDPRGQGRKLRRVFASPLSASLFLMDPDGVKGFVALEIRHVWQKPSILQGENANVTGSSVPMGHGGSGRPFQSSPAWLTIGAAVENGLFKVRAASAAECTAPAFSSSLCPCVTAGLSCVTSEHPVCSALKVL